MHTYMHMHMHMHMHMQMHVHMHMHMHMHIHIRLTYTCFRLWNAHVLPARQVSASKSVYVITYTLLAGKEYGASGVTWLRIGGAHWQRQRLRIGQRLGIGSANGTQQLQLPSGFRFLNNSQLSHALLRKREFTPREWALCMMM